MKVKPKVPVFRKRISNVYKQSSSQNRRAQPAKLFSKLTDAQWKSLKALCDDRKALAETAVDDFMALLVA